MTTDPLDSELPSTLPEALDRAARSFADKGIELYDNRGRLSGRRSYRQLSEATQEAGRKLQRLGVGPGERVVVCLPTSWEWLDLWLGCIQIGALPVATAPPGALGSPAAQIEKTLQVSQRLRARYLACNAAFEAEASQKTAELALGSELRLLGPTLWQQTAPSAASCSRPAPDPDATAFLQLTSGSTGVPRAVQVRHLSAIHNAWASDEAVGAPLGGFVHDHAGAWVSWLPLYHDMGLIGGLMLTLVGGIDLRLLTPRSFLARPQVWLKTVTQGGVAFSPAPNFAYQLATERVREVDLEGSDLGCWQAAMTGSEMIRKETMDAFCARFASHGFDPAAVRACYGMAEATLAITIDKGGRGLRTEPLPSGASVELDLTEVAGNGTPIRDTDVAVVGPDGRPLPPRRIGEVRARGPGVTRGYFEDPEATREILDGDWLCTGDLGFLDERGELFLTGRTKEILILHGQNLMPHELEWIAEGVTGGGGSHRSAAFSVARRGEGEQAVLVLECGDRDEAALTSLRHEVAQRIGRTLSIPLADIVLVRRGTIPKTTSGKVQRRSVRDLYLEGKLPRLDSPRQESARPA